MSQRPRGKAGGGEWSNLATAGESKGEGEREQGRRRVVSSRLGEWENGLVIGGEQAIWLADVLGMRSDAVVDDVGNWREASVSAQSLRTASRKGEAVGLTRGLLFGLLFGSSLCTCTNGPAVSSVTATTTRSFLQFFI